MVDDNPARRNSSLYNSTAEETSGPIAETAEKSMRINMSNEYFFKFKTCRYHFSCFVTHRYNYS